MTIDRLEISAAITSPVAGTVQRLALGAIQQVEGGDLVLVIDPAGNTGRKSTSTVDISPLNSVRDKSIKVDIRTAERADTSRPGHVAAPFAGVVTVTVAEGDEVEAGATVATIEAMKMEAAITSTVAGKVQRLALGAIQQVEGGDLVLVIDPA